MTAGTPLDATAKSARRLVITAQHAVDQAAADGSPELDELRARRLESGGYADGVLLAAEAHAQGASRTDVLARVRALMDDGGPLADPAWRRGVQWAYDVAADVTRAAG